MQDEILISVLMSVYNTEFSMVKRAIDSVLNQDFKHFELIVIDDGSKAESSSQLLHYAQKNQEKITYLRHKNQGQANSINRGLLLGNGQYIAMIDSDDEYKSHHLSACLKEMEHADLIASATHTIVDHEEDYYVPDRNDHNKVVHVDDCVLFATLFGRKEVFLSQKFQNTYAADSHFFERVGEQFRVRKIDLRTYIYYRNNPDSICSNLKKSNKV